MPSGSETARTGRTLLWIPETIKQGPNVPCSQSAANFGYKNHKRWCDEKESARVLSELAISDAIAPPAPRRLNAHIIFPD